MMRFLAMWGDGIRQNEDRRPEGRRSVDSRIMAEKSVSQDVPASDAFRGQDVK